MRPRTHSLLPMPLAPRMSVPMPWISTMLPYSDAVGANSNSSAIVAALMNFIVIIGVRKTGVSYSAAVCRSTGGMLAPPAAMVEGGFGERKCWQRTEGTGALGVRGEKG